MKYKVTDLLREIFGISPIYKIGPGVQQKQPIFYKGIKQLPDYTGSGNDDDYWNDTATLSILGTPVVFNVTLSPQAICKRYDDLGNLIDAAPVPFQIPASTMYQFRRAKNITKTNILGSNGTVKEIFGFDDWIIDVKGICLDTPTQSARHQLKNLLEYSELASAINVSGALFNLLEINAVVIEDFSFNILQGSNGGVISFQMQLTSDEPIEFQMKDGR